MKTCTAANCPNTLAEWSTTFCPIHYVRQLFANSDAPRNAQRATDRENSARLRNDREGSAYSAVNQTLPIAIADRGECDARAIVIALANTPAHVRQLIAEMVEAEAREIEDRLFS